MPIRRRKPRRPGAATHGYCIAWALSLALLVSGAERSWTAERPRLAILTDIGGDPDDRQSLIRLMVYANEFEIEALVASAAGTPGELNVATTRPDLIEEIVATYEQVRPNLARHAGGWPRGDALLARVASGNPDRGRAHIGAGHDTDGSRLLVQRIESGT